MPPRGFDAPIVEKNGFYTYDDPTFSIDKLPLSETDLESISDAVDLLNQYKQLPIHSQLSLVKDKFTGEIYTNTEDEPIIELDHLPVKGEKFLSPIYQCIKEKTVISLEYQSFKSTEPKEFLLHPYFIKQYNHRWYLIALSELFGTVGTYSLDRIISLDKEKSIAYNASHRKGHLKRFEDIIGVTLIDGDEPVTIEAKVTPEQSPYITTKKIHNSQTITSEDESGTYLSLYLIPNYEFYSSILAFGPGIQVLGPQHIRDEVCKRIKDTLSQYHQK
tara:strand:+ start:17769 stop:18593 length:825 start_codon:yes stop_codon:yes gene_type:complete